MNEQMYNDAKKMLEALAAKVPSTWEVLVTEHVRSAWASLILTGVVEVFFGLSAWYLLRRGLHIYRTRKSLDDEFASTGWLVAGCFAVVACLVLLLPASEYMRAIVAPNTTLAKALLK